MGYTSGELRISLRAERHNSEGDLRDNQAIEDLKMEIEALIASNDDYQRVASLGVSGGL